MTGRAEVPPARHHAAGDVPTVDQWVEAPVPSPRLRPPPRIAALPDDMVLGTMEFRSVVLWRQTRLVVVVVIGRLKCNPHRTCRAPVAISVTPDDVMPLVEVDYMEAGTPAFDLRVDDSCCHPSYFMEMVRNQMGDAVAWSECPCTTFFMSPFPAHLVVVQANRMLRHSIAMEDSRGWIHAGTKYTLYRKAEAGERLRLMGRITGKFDYDKVRPFRSLESIPSLL